jgi:hypothetical protein
MPRMAGSAAGVPVRRRQAQAQAQAQAQTQLQQLPHLGLVAVVRHADGSLPAHDTLAIRSSHALDFLSLPRPF